MSKPLIIRTVNQHVDQVGLVYSKPTPTGQSWLLLLHIIVVMTSISAAKLKI